MKVLLAVDGSTFTTNAVAFLATRFQRSPNAPELHLLHVQLPIPPGLAVSRASAVLGDDAINDYYKEEASAVLAPAEKLLREYGIPFQSHYKIGHVSDEVQRFASEQKMDLIVMGSHGHTALVNTMLGSVTTEVLSMTTIPVLIIRKEASRKSQGMKILLAVDGSPFTIRAVQYLTKHLDMFQGAPALHLLHVGAPLPMGMAMTYERAVIEPDDVEAYYRAGAAEALAPAVKLLGEAAIAFETFTSVGYVAHEINDHVVKHEIDMIVMGSHGHGVLKNLVLGSVATKVLAASTVPVLIVR